MRNAKIVSVLLASLVMLAACGANDKNGDAVTAAGTAQTTSAAVTLPRYPFPGHPQVR
ncbi:unknown [Anaerotruncus sp. CAG:390]|nr:unknown [Anaerotruncus sp. CAG:390]